MPSSDENELVQEYRSCKRLYEDFAETVSDLLTKIIADKSLQLHSVTCRSKDEQSLAKKLQRPGSVYQNLGEITDLAGVRVITYFHDHVDFIAQMVEAEFTIDRENSTDKRALLDPDRFGYLSLHYIVGLPPSRCSLTEYKRFKGLKAEIQIRSLLQHVWAEVEHDLGYKSSVGVPSTIRRRFARLAGLLELADAEFVAIRDDLSAYEEKVPQLIADTPASVPLDQASIIAFANNSDLVHQLDEFILSIVSSRQENPHPFLEGLIVGLNFLEIITVNDLDNALRNHQEDIKRLTSAMLAGRRGVVVSLGICIYYLQWAILVRKGDRGLALKWAANFPGQEKFIEGVFAACAKPG
jgi:ppGpp synthetase/RelA/SpoT-type nucleotidyltranferase